MLMQASFQALAAGGAQLLYTDTDSVAFSCTPKVWTAYKRKFVLADGHQEFGGMELEGVYSRFVGVVPKKYACIKDDGDYEWACNGVPARTNTRTDVLQ